MADVRCEEIVKSLGGKPVLSGVTFSVQRGEIFGLLGPNGAGKTTTIRILLGLLKPDRGLAEVLGADRVGTPGLNRRIGFVLDCDGLYDALTAEENLAYYCKLYQVSGISHATKEALAAARLAGRAGDRVRSFSTGMRKRLSLARATLHSPELLVLDEPTGGIDPEGKAEVLRQLQALASQGTTVLLSSHNLDEVERVCGAVAMIRHGTVAACGGLDDLLGGGTRRSLIRLGAAPPDGLVSRLRRLGVAFSGGDCRELVLDQGTSATLNDVISLLVSAGCQIQQVSQQRRTLAELYSTLIAGNEP